MQFKALATLLFAALAVANPAPAPQAGDDLNALMDSVPSSVLDVLMTAIPPSVVAALANPTQAASIVQEIEQGQVPDWYANLPDSVKSWASSAAMAELGGVPTATPAGSASTPTVTSPPSETTSGNTATTSSGSAGAASTSIPTSTPNTAPTGAVAVSFAGAAGMLALALAL